MTIINFTFPICPYAPPDGDVYLPLPDYVCGSLGEVVFLHGELVDLLVPTVILEFDILEGVISETQLTPYALFRVINNHGDYNEFSLATEVILSTTSSHGEYQLSDLTINLPDLMSVTFGSGEIISSEIYEIIKNGSFELPVKPDGFYYDTGTLDFWTYAGSSIVRNISGVTYIDGRQACWLQGASTVSQVFTIVGEPAKYNITFWAVGRPSYGPAALKVQIDGVDQIIAQSGTTTITPSMDGIFNRFTVENIDLTVGTHTLKFLGVDDPYDHASLIDLVSINEAAPPRFDPRLYHGESSNTDLQISYNLSPNVYEGELVQSGLAVSALLSPTVLHGELAASDLTTVPAPNMTVSVLVGELIQTNFAISYLFNPIFGYGELSAVDFTTFETDYFIVNAADGQNSTSSVTTSTSFAPNAYHGDGSTTDFFIQPASFLAPNILVGESSNTTVAASYGLSSNGYHGEGSTTDLALFEADILEALANSGETISASMNLTVSLKSYTYPGEYSDTTVSTYPSSASSVYYYHGDTFTIDRLITEVVFTTGAIGHGDRVILDSLGVEPNIIFGEGAAVSAHIASNVIFGIISPIAGEYVISNFSNNPPASLAVICRHGESSVSELVTQYAAKLWTVVREGVRLDVSITDSTFIDLGPPTYSTEKQFGIWEQVDINMDLGEPFQETFIGPATSRLTFELSATPRLDVGFEHGEVLRLIDNTIEISSRFSDTSNLWIDLLADINFRLCPGAYLPAGDNVFVELEDTIDDQCSSKLFKHGDSLHLKSIYSVVGLSMNFKHGDDLYLYFVNDMPWQMHFMHGEIVNWYEINLFPGEFRHGESINASFPKTYDYIYAGEEIISTLTLDFNLIFLQYPGLPNEYIYQNAAGDEIEELFSPLAIEGYPYRHVIKIGCY